jgi:acyl-CoA thioester hydrolase
MPTSPTPEQGVIDGRVHRLPLRVYYEDTDAGGIVYHAGYLRFAERARTELLRCLGFDHVTLRDRLGLVFAVRRCIAEFLAPARLDERLTIETRLERLGRASLDLEQRVVAPDGRLLVKLEVRLALLSGALRPARLPAELRAACAELAGAETPAPDRARHDP